MPFFMHQPRFSVAPSVVEYDDEEPPLAQPAIDTRRAMGSASPCAAGGSGKGGGGSGAGWCCCCRRSMRLVLPPPSTPLLLAPTPTCMGAAAERAREGTGASNKDFTTVFSSEASFRHRVVSGECRAWREQHLPPPPPFASRQISDQHTPSHTHTGTEHRENAEAIARPDAGTRRTSRGIPHGRVGWRSQYVWREFPSSVSSHPWRVNQDDPQ